MSVIKIHKFWATLAKELVNFNRRPPSALDFKNFKMHFICLCPSFYKVTINPHKSKLFALVQFLSYIKTFLYMGE